MTIREPRDGRLLDLPISGAGSSDPAALTRRTFIGRAAGSGMAFALPVGLAACGGSDDATPIEPQARTLFFNLAHENHQGKTYWLTGGGRRHALVPCSAKPEVLRRVRATHDFLRMVPDSQITHLVEGVVFAADSITLCYVSADIDTVAGTWSMSSIQFVIPPAAAQQAYASARHHTPTGPLPLSAKRRIYGAAPAQSARDLKEENDLLDSSSHAATLVGCHPDLISLEPNAAQTVQSNHVGISIDVVLLGSRLRGAGPALPEQVAGQPNTRGWATLVPVRDGDGVNGAPLINTKGLHKGRIQYQPDTHPSLQPLARSAIVGIVPGVKNDTTLGADITQLDPGPNDPPNPMLSGTLWMRHDGTTSVDQSSGTFAAAAAATMTLKRTNPQGGFKVSASTSSSAGGAITVELKFISWYLEFRGVYLQFLDAGGNVLKLADIPEYQAGTIQKTHSNAQDTADAMLLAVVGPVFTVLAIPVAPGFSHPSFTVPGKASTVRILSSGLSFQGGNVYAETVLPGAIMTGVYNYGVTALLAAVGGAKFANPMLKAIVVPEIQTIARELILLVGSALGSNLAAAMKTPAFWAKFGLFAAKSLVTAGVGAGLAKLVAFIAASVGEAAAEDAIPVAGQIMQGVSIAAGVASLAETSIELAVTPWTHIDDLVFTHDLSLTLQPDANDNTFPKAADSYTVTALFDSGTPHTQTLALASAVATLPPVKFSGVPLGGRVDLSVAFVQKATTPGGADVLLGKGSTGAIDNTSVNQNPTLAIEELRFPISATTVYRHTQKTTLDTVGRHVWSSTAAAPAVNAATSVCGLAGTICAFRGITVRQGTRNVPGYLGYAWQAQNTDPSVAPSCVGGGAGQLDQLANLNTNGASAQNGYVNGDCGIGVGGVRVAYSLLTQGGANFYLDTTDPDAPMLRQVTLGATPAIAPPLSGQAWGVLNFASDALLLHPAGHLVSINKATHKIETHRLPGAPLADAEAKVALLAQPKSGKGSRPGLIDTPVAAAISSDGVILVLEQGNNRIQAFDLGANPVPHFSAQKTPYSLTLSVTDSQANWQYLDLAVEFTGFIYVLSYKTDTFDYRLDIYHPKQSGTQPIATTTNMNAARLAVDFWRNVYTLNYEVLQMPGGVPAPLTEPSVSLWTP